MEKVYDVKGFRATDNFSTAEYFKEFGKVCPAVETTTIGKFFELMGNRDLSQFGIDFTQLEIMCDVENLRLPNEPVHIPIDIPEKLCTQSKLPEIFPINNEARHLNMIRTKEVLDSIRTAPYFKFGGKRSLRANVDETRSKNDYQDICPSGDFIYSIIVYKPCSIYQGPKNSGEKLRFGFEIEALGRNVLSDVIDIIDCESNFRVVKEVENTNVNLSDFKDAKKKYPSQTVFIDGVFYNDTRVPEAIDLSPKIIEWAKEKNIGNFTTDKMQEVTLSSLKPRFGYPYVYIHQGDCEHIVVFSDARLIQTEDCLTSSKYPKITSFSRTVNIMCFICTSRPSTWMVVKCELFPQEKIFTCTECCNSYLYLNNNKVTDFRLFPFFQQK